jgi:translation initiation factor 1 (eIF-1/SUI1)
MFDKKIDSVVSSVFRLAGTPPTKTIIIKAYDQDNELENLLKELKHMCAVGSSRKIVIEEWDGENSFHLDGDGADKILSLEITND